MAKAVTIVEMTWFFSSPPGLPATARPTLDTIRRLWPSALPVRYGPGDPPAERVDADLTGFETYWAERATEDWGASVNWVGSDGVYHVAINFADRRDHVVSAGIPIGTLSISLDVKAAQGDHDALVDFFSAIAESGSCVYGCAYVLRGWTVSRGVLFSNLFESEESPIPAGKRWIGIPPGAPWLAWLGSAYTSTVEGLLGDRGERMGDGVLLRAGKAPQTMDDAADTLPSFPDELLAQRPDPRFWAARPSAPARFIPVIGDPEDE